jgi:hypothetical protein
MEVLAALPDIKSKLLARGTLGMAEELAGEIAPLIEGFLSTKPPHSPGQDPDGNV